MLGKVCHPQLDMVPKETPLSYSAQKVCNPVISVVKVKFPFPTESDAKVSTSFLSINASSFKNKMILILYHPVSLGKGCV